MNDYICVCDVEKYYGNGSNVTKAIDRWQRENSWESWGLPDRERRLCLI